MSNHKTSVLLPDADTAVLFIHGIVGSPAHFRQVIDLESRVPKHWSFVNVCLPGHGGSVMDFAGSSMNQWRDYVQTVFSELASTHRQVVLIGHSMGTLFALQLAVQYPERVGGLLLLQCPLQVGLRWFGVLNLIRLPFGWIKPENTLGSAMLVACGVRTERNIFKYSTWIPRILELFSEIHRTNQQLSRLTTPAIAFQSLRDELVSNRSSRLLRRSAWVRVLEFEDATHFYYPEPMKARIYQGFDDIIQKIN